MPQQKMSELPKGWSKTSIGDFLDIHNGKRKPISLTERANRKGQFPYYGATGIIDYLDGYTHEGEYILIGEDGANILSKSKPLAFLADGKYWVNNHAHTAKCPLDCPNKYIEKYINSLSLEPWVTGSAQPKLNKGNLEKIPVPLPPIAEQKRIVEKLDSLLAQVDTIQQRLNTLPNIIKRFRQSVLAAAVSGKLTEQWRGDNRFQLPNNIHELNIIERQNRLKSRIQAPKLCETPSKFTIPTSWDWISIDEGCIKITDGTHHSPVSTGEGDYKYVTSKNVREGYIDLSKMTYVSKEVHSEIYARCDVVKGDVLYVKDGANTGLACVNNIEEEISLLSSVGVMKVTSYVNSVYLQHYLNSPIGRKLMLDLMGGTAIKRLTLTKIKISPLSLPPIEEQTEIVRLVEQYFALADTLEKHLKNAKQRVDNLTQAILAKAFKGELVPQDPSDEPAEQLLARIKAAREQAEALEKAAKKVAKASKAKK
jgi:type I restriction enzyme S subunit